MVKEGTARCFYIFVLTLALQFFCLGIVPTSIARNLADVFVEGFPTVPLGGVPTDQFAEGLRADADAFSIAVSQAVTQEFPLASVSPAFTYRFNPTLSIFERSTGVPGPLFSERALTIGQGQWNLSVGYSFVDFTDLNGTSLHDLRTPGLVVNDDVMSPERIQVTDPDILSSFELNPGEQVFVVPRFLSQFRNRIDLNAHIIAPSLRYGITDKWDVGITIPLVDTFLRVRSEVVPVADAVFPDDEFAIYAIDAKGNARELGVAQAEGDLSKTRFVKTSRSPGPVLKNDGTPVRAAGSAFGVGDISLRTKYTFWQREAGGAALGLNLQLPTGNKGDFHGTDETHLSTFVYLSQVIGERVEPHLNLGVDFNADDVDRSSFLYAVGGTLLVWKNLGVMVDFIGRSEFGRLKIRLPEGAFYPGNLLDRDPQTCTQENPCFRGATQKFPLFAGRIKRNAPADFSFGLRYALGTSGSVFFGGIIPLNNDGFRADFIPSGGIEYTF